MRRLKEIQADMTPKEVFALPETKRYINNLLDAVIDEVKVDLHLAFDEEPSAPVGYTDGRKVYLNAGSSIIQSYTIMENKFLALLGVAFHEAAHMNFLDFNAEQRYLKSINENGKLVGKINFVDEDTEESFYKALETPELRPIIGKLVHELHNIIADAHDERLMCEKFGGLVERAIQTSAESLKASSATLESMEDTLGKGMISELRIMYSLLLQYARYGEIVVHDDEKMWENPHISVLVDAMEDVDAAKYEDTMKKRNDYVNNLVVFLWPYVDTELTSLMSSMMESSGSSDGSPSSSTTSSPSSGSSEASPEDLKKAVEKILDELGKASEDVAKGAETPKKLPRKKKDDEKEKEKGEEEKDEVKTSDSEMSAEDALKKLAKELEHLTKRAASETAEKEAEEADAKKIKDDVDEMEVGALHKKISIKVNRILDVSESDKRKYSDVFSTVKKYSRALQKQIKAVLKEDNDEYTMRHKVFGKKLEVRDAYRLDGKCFSKKKLPHDSPDLAVFFLGDQSGSMSCDGRMATVRKAAILMEDVCRGLNVPCMIAGHEEQPDHMNFNIFCTFDKRSANDKYRIIKMVQGWNNRDGLAIKTGLELLAKRPEQHKLFIIASDGEPAGFGYSGISAVKDIQEAVRWGKKHGIETFAYAIGDDKPQIQKIYKDGFVDISDLNSLPRVVAKMIKKKML